MNDNIQLLKNHFWMMKEFLLFKKATLISLASFAAVLLLYMFVFIVSGSNNSFLSIIFLMLGIFFFWLNVLMGIILWDKAQSFKKFARFIAYLKPQDIDTYFPLNAKLANSSEQQEKENFLAMKEKAEQRALNLNEAIAHINQMPELGKRLSVPSY